MHAHLQEPGKSVEATLRGNVPTREIYVSWNVKSPNWQFNMFLLCLGQRLISRNLLTCQVGSPTSCTSMYDDYIRRSYVDT